MKTALIGDYNRLGYTIWQGSRIIYTALNHRQDSQQPAYTEADRMTLREIRSACIKTCKEMAAEQGTRFAGVFRAADEGY